MDFAFGCFLPVLENAPAEVYDLNNAKKECFIIIAVWFFLLILVAPVCASPFPIVIRGTILELNETGQTLLLQADCRNTWCQVNVTGKYIGRIPDPLVLSYLKKGETVEAVFNAWYWQLHDSSTGYVNPSDEVRNIGKWGAIQKLAYGDNITEFIGTDVFGDTAYLKAPLASDYTIEYDIRGPPPIEYDFRNTPPGTIANITLKREGGVAGTWSLKAGESFNYTNLSDNSFIIVTFVGGYRPDTYGLESCPCTDLSVRIRSDETMGAHVIPMASSPTPKQKAPALPALVILAIGSVIIFRGLIRDHR